MFPPVFKSNRVGGWEGLGRLSCSLSLLSYTLCYGLAQVGLITVLEAILAGGSGGCGSCMTLQGAAKGPRTCDDRRQGSPRRRLVTCIEITNYRTQ